MDRVPRTLHRLLSREPDRMNALTPQREDLTRSRGEATVMGKSLPRLLIVDDDARAVRIFRRVLSQADKYCLSTDRASEVIATLRAHPSIDVVVSDLRMPETDGIRLLREVREQFRDRRWLQFILVTGQASIESAISALRLEAVDYLFKPVMPKNLITSVRNALLRAEAYRDLLDAQPREVTSESLRYLARLARTLAGELSAMTAGLPDADVDPSSMQANPVTAGASPHVPRLLPESRSHGQEYEALRMLLGLHEARASLFGHALMSDPAWEMLTELMLVSMTGRRVAVTSLCLASKAPVTTALRRIDDLIAAGLAVRVRDSEDRRRSYIELTDQGQEKMQSYLVTVASSLDRTIEFPQHIAAKES